MDPIEHSSNFKISKPCKVWNSRGKGEDSIFLDKSNSRRLTESEDIEKILSKALSVDNVLLGEIQNF